MTISYAQYININITDIKNLYANNNWLAYLNDDTMLANAYNNSLYTYTAHYNDQLVGLIRCVGDGEHIVVVQDLIVLETYQRQGIGSTLLQHVCDRYAHVRIKLLLTDLTDTRAKAFYQQQGWTAIDKMHMIAYAK